MVNLIEIKVNGDRVIIDKTIVTSPKGYEYYCAYGIIETPKGKWRQEVRLSTELLDNENQNAVAAYVLESTRRSYEVNNRDN